MLPIATAAPITLRSSSYKWRAAGGGALHRLQGFGADTPAEGMMPRLILQFENRVLKEYPTGVMVTIGRLPDNVVIIDNPAVSSHHACVHRDGNQFIVEDLQSTNGTFVNEKRVTRQTLRDGDVVLIGKHQIVFDAMGAGEMVDSVAPEPVLSMGDTVYLNTAQHRALLAKLGEPDAKGRQVAKVAILRVVAGRTDRA